MYNRETLRRKNLTDLKHQDKFSTIWLCNFSEIMKKIKEEIVVHVGTTRGSYFIYFRSTIHHHREIEMHAFCIIEANG